MSRKSSGGPGRRAGAGHGHGRGSRASREELRLLVGLRRSIADDGVAIIDGCVIVDGRHMTTHYTVGLTRYDGHPEVIVADVCCDGADELLAAAVRIVRQGHRIESGCGISQEPSADDPGYRSVFIDVDDPWHLRLAQLLYSGSGRPVVPAVQMVLANGAGWLPWESGDAGAVLLGRPPVVAE